MKLKLNKFIGDRAFYKNVLAIALPLMIQNAVTNFVNLLDNIMVGALNTEAMSGVSIVNQFIFIFNITVFGAIAGAGIYTSQFHGRGDTEGVRGTFRLKLIFNLIIGALGVLVFLTLGDSLISSFLHEGTEGDLTLTRRLGNEYLSYAVIGLIPFALTQAYSSTLRETGETVVPMVSSIVSVLTNCVLNAILIFGLLGFPALGVVGAAIATVVSRFAELAVLVIWTHTHCSKYTFIKGALSSPKVPLPLFRGVVIKTMPMLANELLWSLAVTMRNQCFSTRGLDVVAATTISSTIINLLTVAYMAIAISVGIIVGKELGAGEIERAKDTCRKLLTLAFIMGAVIGIAQAVFAPVFPLMYNTTDGVRSMATALMLISAAFTPFNAVSMASYFTLRAGGRVIIAALSDSVYAWGAIMSVLLILTHLTGAGIMTLFTVAAFIEALKCPIGILILSKVKWAKQLVIKD